MQKWIRDPQYVSPGTAMKDLNVGQGDARDITTNSGRSGVVQRLLPVLRCDAYELRFAALAPASPMSLDHVSKPCGPAMAHNAAHEPSNHELRSFSLDIYTPIMPVARAGGCPAAAG
jgi:hypothetical protein